MTTIHDAATIGAMLRRRGLPQRPVVGVPVTEIRSDTFLGNIPTLEPGTHGAALGALLIEWRFAVPYHILPEILQFLSDNDLFIAEGCKAAMKGVSYAGTYMGAAGQRAAFRTIWAYSSWEAYDEWAKVTDPAAPQNARLHEVVAQLRGYWLMDPDGSQEHLAYAAGVDIDAHPFMKLTVEADKKANGK
jgi:hypothetical protein